MLSDLVFSEKKKIPIVNENTGLAREELLARSHDPLVGRTFELDQSELFLRGLVGFVTGLLPVRASRKLPFT